MIRWLWLIPTLALGAAIGLMVMRWLVAGKIADLEAALRASQTHCNNPCPPWECPPLKIDRVVEKFEPPETEE